MESKGTSDKQYLERLLKDGEGQKLEVKLSVDNAKDNVAKAICGMANLRGGKVVVGLAEVAYYKPEMGGYEEKDVLSRHFIVIGVKNGDRSRLELASHMRSHTNVSVDLQNLYNIRQLSVNNKTLLVIKVKPFYSEQGTLVLYRGVPYRRLDNQTVVLTARDLVQILSSTPNQSQQANINEASDELSQKVIHLVVTAGKASTSYLQRRLGIGYNRAGRIIDKLELLGIIDKPLGSKPRKVLVSTLEEAEQKIKQNEHKLDNLGLNSD